MMLRFSFLTLFPQLLRPFLNEAIIGKSLAQGHFAAEVYDLREHAGNRHHKVDDTPYGGGAGMVIRVDVVERALAHIAAIHPIDEVIMLTPAGERFDQKVAEEWAETPRHSVILCGRYEGFDARVETLVQREISVGDWVMMGGEAAAACILEAVTRLVPGVLGDAESHQHDSFSSGLLDYPEYTRPQIWRGESVPEVLLSGDHGKVADWRRAQALARTLARRPELLPKTTLSPSDSVHLVSAGLPESELASLGAPPPPQPKAKRRKRRA